MDKLGEDFSLENAGGCTVEIDKNVMYITLDRALIGLSGEFSVYFKVADGIESPEDIMDYYVSGQSVPMGRFSFWYKGR